MRSFFQVESLNRAASLASRWLRECRTPASLRAPKSDNPVLRTQLKSKLHRALVTDANIDYEGSISIPLDLMQRADLWEGEKVLVTSITNGARLETYVIPGATGSGQIVINGAAAHLISTGHRVTIMAFGLSDQPLTPRRLLLNGRNEVVSTAAK